MNIKENVQEMDAIVSQGAIVEAVDKFFADHAITSDYGNGKTNGKPEMLEKMKGFAVAIAKVNGITHHHSIVDGNTSASEFTFNFDMKDGSKVYWHEIIRRIWNKEGKVIEEQYFNAE